MKIATVTLNPAIDQTVRVDNLRLNSVNRAQEIRVDASGKGVNVAAFLADYGHDTAVTGYLGQANIDIFELFFASKGIDDCFVRIPGSTRINVKVVDEVNQQTTTCQVKLLLRKRCIHSSKPSSNWRTLAIGSYYLALCHRMCPPRSMRRSSPGSEDKKSVSSWIPAEKPCVKVYRQAQLS